MEKCNEGSLLPISLHVQRGQTPWRAEFDFFFGHSANSNQVVLFHSSLGQDHVCVTLLKKIAAIEGTMMASEGRNSAIASKEQGNASIGIAVVGTKHRFHRLDFKYLTPGFSDCEALAQKLGKRIEKSQSRH